MEFLQHFHTEFSSAQKSGLAPEKWLIGSGVLAELKRMALEQGKVLHKDATILGFPYEVGAAGSNEVELVTRTWSRKKLRKLQR